MRVNLSLLQLVRMNAFLGEHRKLWNSNMNMFIIGHKYDIYFIDLKYTIFLLKKSLKIIKKNYKYNTIFIVPFSMKDNLLYSLSKYQLNILVRSKWIFGLLTNYKNFKVSSNKWLTKAMFPKTIIFFFRNLYKRNYLTISKEIKDLKIIFIGFINTKINPSYFDYYIPINNNSIEIIKFYFRAILFYLRLLEWKKQEKLIKDIFNFIK